jgi:hypothetical protein
LARDSSGGALLVARWLVLGVLALATVVGFVVARKHDRSSRDSGERYTCPMHPEVTSVTPGECPICRMALARVPAGGGPGSAALAATPERDRDEGYAIRPVVFTDSIRAPAFVESRGVLAAHLYVDELSALEPGMHGDFSPATAPAASVEAHGTSDPPSPWDDCTLLVHFRVDPDDPRLHRGDTGWLQFAPKVRSADLVPLSAVLQSPDGPYVFAAGSDHQPFERRGVELGKAFFGHAVVLSGLRERESVAVNGLFFLDAERRLRHDPVSADTSVGPAR